MTIRIVLVDDHPVVLGGLGAALQSHADIEVVGHASTLSEARILIDNARPDVALIDIRLPDGSGMELLESAAEEGQPAFIMVTTFDAPQYVEVAIELGASGFLLKTSPTEEIVSAVRRVASGGRVFAGDRGSLRRGEKWRPLSAREHDVVASVVAGRSNDEISGDLGISTKTVEWHLSRLFERFSVASRVELAMRAEREGWLALPTGTKSGGRTDRPAK
jgi:two-component system, NarL family, response regulator DesR